MKQSILVCRALRLFGVVALLASAACDTQEEAAAPAASPPPAQPNIVLILADDLGWADLPSYGNAVTLTPHIDTLADEGARFTRFYAEPVCSPSRAALQTGQYPARPGITDFISGHWRPFETVVTPRPTSGLPASATTIGEALRAQGYVTGYFGKWHLGTTPDSQPSMQGYDEAFTGIGFDHLTEGVPSTEVLGDKAAAFIAQHTEEPFFLMLSPTQPHIPLRARAATIAKYEARLEELGVTLPDPIYAAMIEDLDNLVGRVAAEIEKAGLGERTVLIFASDNGGLEHLDLGIGDPVTINAPLRGEKGTVLEGGIRVPLIVKWPSVVPGGTVVKHNAALIDLLPTFLDMARAEEGAKAELDGESLVPALRGGEDMADGRALFIHYPHYHHGRPASAVIMGDMKLIEYLDDGSLALYDLARDEGERRNLAEAQPELAADLQTTLAAWREEVGAKMPAPNPDHDPARAAEWWSFETKKPVDMDYVRNLLARGVMPSE